MGSYLFKFFWITLCSQYLLKCMIHYLLRYYKDRTILQKRCSRICGLNPGLIYLQKVPKNSFLKLNFLKDIFQVFSLYTTITIIAWNMPLTEQFFHNRIFIFGALATGKRARNNPKWKVKITSITCHISGTVAYDHDFWYICAKWWYLQTLFFLFFWSFHFLGC